MPKQIFFVACLVAAACTHKPSTVSTEQSAEPALFGLLGESARSKAILAQVKRLEGNGALQLVADSIGAKITTRIGAKDCETLKSALTFLGELPTSFYHERRGFDTGCVVIFFDDEAVLTDDDIKALRREIDPRLGMPLVTIELNEEATKKFANFTEARVGQFVAIRISGKIILTPGLNDSIPNGLISISLGTTKQEQGWIQKLMAKLES